MKYWGPILLLVIIISIRPMADDMGMVGNGDMQFILNSVESQKKPKNDAEAAEQVQAMLIQRVFLEPMFSEENSEFKFREDEEDEDDFGSSSSQYNQMYNGIMMKEMSKMLAKRDVLKLRKMLGREQPKQTEAIRNFP